MKKETKVSLVKDLKGVLDASTAMVVTDYRGLSVERISVLRRGCRKAGASLKVVKNTLLRKAVPGTPFAAADPLFEGPTAVAIGQGDPVALVKALTAFAKENEIFTIKGGVIGGRTFSAPELTRMAALPPREVLLAKAVGSMASPLSRMVGTLGNPLRGFVGVLRAYGAAKAA